MPPKRSDRRLRLMGLSHELRAPLGRLKSALGPDAGTVGRELEYLELVARRLLDLVVLEGASLTDCTPADEPSALVRRIEAVAILHLADPGFGAAELAQKAGISPRHLLRHVREEAGQSTAAWLLELRLRAARGMLREGRVSSVQEAAARVGLSPSYLARAYTRWAGCRPSDDLR